MKLKDKKIIYIELTYNFKRRIRDHFKSERILTLIDRYGKDKIISKKLTEYLDNQEAIKKEGEFVNFMKERKKYEILNEKTTGGLGGTTIIWNKKKILIEAKKYKTIKEWMKMILEVIKLRGLWVFFLKQLNIWKIYGKKNGDERKVWTLLRV